MTAVSTSHATGNITTALLLLIIGALTTPIQISQCTALLRMTQIAIDGAKAARCSDKTTDLLSPRSFCVAAL